MVYFGSSSPEPYTYRPEETATHTLAPKCRSSARITTAQNDDTCLDENSRRSAHPYSVLAGCTVV